MSTYRAGIIGLGYIGAGDDESGQAIGGQLVKNLDGTHAAALAGHPNIELVAGSTRDAGRRERFEKRYPGAKTYSDFREMLTAESLDIVSVATYAKVHAPMTIAAAQAGVKAVYCEKPIATTLADSEAMIQACESSNTLLVLNHNRRFNPNYRKLRDLIAAGELGDLCSVSIQWAGGRLGNVATHHFDAACMLTGRRVEKVSAILDKAGRPDCRGDDLRDPGGWGLLRFAGGLIATVDAADYSTAPLMLAINGTKGRAITGRAEVDITYSDGRTDHWPSAVAERSSMHLAVDEIVAHLDGTAPFSYPAEESMHVFESIVAAHASDRKDGAWVDLPLEGDDRAIEVLSG